MILWTNFKQICSTGIRYHKANESNHKTSTQKAFKVQHISVGKETMAMIMSSLHYKFLFFDIWKEK